MKKGPIDGEIGIVLRTLRSYAKIAHAQGLASNEEHRDYFRGRAEAFESAIEAIKRELLS